MDYFSEWSGSREPGMKGQSHCFRGIFEYVCFTNCANGYTKSPKLTGVHATYSSLTSNVVTGNRIQGWTSKELKAFGTEVCEFKRKVVELFSFVCA